MKAFMIHPGCAGSGDGKYGEAPAGADYLITGHESLGRVVAAPPGTLRPGELVVAIVRRPDPVPLTIMANALRVGDHLVERLW